MKKYLRPMLRVGIIDAVRICAGSGSTLKKSEEEADSWGAKKGIFDYDD